MKIKPHIFTDHDLELLGARDVIGHVTIGIVVGYFLWVIHCHHASILQHRYGDMTPQTLDTDGWSDARTLR